MDGLDFIIMYYMLYILYLYYYWYFVSKIKYVISNIVIIYGYNKEFMV